MWLEITDLCKNSCKELNFKDSYISNENFSPYDAMSAMELMDKKMDPCCGLRSDDSIRFEDLLYCKFENPLNYKECSLLLVVLINYFVAYLDGASLLESTHQCKLMWQESWNTFELENENLVDYKLFCFYSQFDEI